MGTYHNALYIGTSDGHILKIYDTDEGPAPVVEAVHVFAKNYPVVNLLTTHNQVSFIRSNFLFRQNPKEYVQYRCQFTGQRTVPYLSC